MDAAVVYHWNRPRYPLQALSMGSAQPYTATSSAEIADGSSMNLLTNSTPSNDGPAPWYRAVTDNRGTSDLITSQLANGSKLLSHQPVEDTQATDESPTAVSLSHRSAPSPSSPRTSHDYRSRKGMTESISSSTQLPDNQNTGFGMPTQWGRNTYVIQAATDSTLEHHPRTPTPTAEEEHEHEQSPVEVPELDQNVAMKRTLRRMPRSRRITSPIPPEVVGEVSYSLQLTENEQSMASSVKNPCSLPQLDCFPEPDM